MQIPLAFPEGGEWIDALKKAYLAEKTQRATELDTFIRKHAKNVFDQLFDRWFQLHPEAEYVTVSIDWDDEPSYHVNFRFEGQTQDNYFRRAALATELRAYFEDMAEDFIKLSDRGHDHFRWHNSHSKPHAPGDLVAKETK